MKRKIRTLIAVMAFVTLPAPTWLYASGNLPLFFPMPEEIVSAVKASWPGPVGATFKEAHWIFERLRSMGLDIPLTYNERLLCIARMKLQVTALCDDIITGR